MTKHSTNGTAITFGTITVHKINAGRLHIYPHACEVAAEKGWCPHMFPETIRAWGGAVVDQ